MGTRALIHIKEGKKTLVTLYRQFDGYPTGLGQDIKSLLNDGKARLVNGYSGGDKSPEAFNGIGCMAAYLIGALKNPVRQDNPLERTNSIGNVYIMAPNANDVGEEFTYTLMGNKDGTITLIVSSYGGDSLYEGPLSEFDPKKVESQD